MTNEEAINILIAEKATYCFFARGNAKSDEPKILLLQALDMAISALSQIESAGTQITNLNLKSESEIKVENPEIKVDLISRESVLGILYDNLGKGWRDVDGDYVEGKICKDAIDDIKKLPTYSTNLVKESGVLVKDLVKDGDLISRNNLLKELEKWEWQELYLPIHFAELVADLPSAEKTAEWIPVNDRMPEFNDIVLASTVSDYDEFRVVITVYKAEEFWFNGTIKAWMPLPEPYKAESEDDG